MTTKVSIKESQNLKNESKKILNGFNLSKLNLQRSSFQCILEAKKEESYRNDHHNRGNGPAF